ncbi:VrrA/YqfQ family protein [Halalkalibacter alkalisediminis]|uniref:VrrA/YqfQ family protein n=1 Tax=Halalkalibacter alkalisediminis TaxID=935616 RepID=A0ABV6NBF5_9BACI|nr:VrrA/YqfQ family protein [Halalkalibacter alkalisediminis]
MQPFFGPPFSSMPMQAPMQGMSQAANMLPGGHMSPMAGVGSQAMRGGGVLSRLLGGLGGGASNMASAPAMGGFSSAGAAGGMNFTTILTNAQKVLGLTQQVMPMIHQYGPLIRNAPALWKIMRSTNSTDDSNPSPEQPMNVPVATEIPIEDEESFSNSIERAPSSKGITPTVIKPKTIDGIPAPKLYV